jgi:PEGA domain
MRAWMGLLGLLVASAAFAQDRSAVVAVGQCSVAGNAIAARSFRAALTQRYGPSVQTEVETAAPFGGLAERTVPELNGSLSSARSDFYSDKPDAALATLNKALEDITRVAPSDTRWSTERDMFTFLAQMQLKTDRAAAESSLARVFRVDPDYKPDTTIYPPSFQRFAADVKKAVKKQPTNRLDIAVSPSGKRVYVGGKRMGVAPLSIRVPAGDYRVEVDWGYRGLGRKVTVPVPPAVAKPVELAQSVEGGVAPDGGPCVEPLPDVSGALARLLPLVGASKIYGVRSETSGADQYATVTEVTGGGAEQRTVRVKLAPGAPEGEALGLMAGYFSTGRAGPQLEVVSKTGGAAGAAAVGAAAGAGAAGVAAAVPPPAGPARVTPPAPAAPPPSATSAPPAAVSKTQADGGAGLRTAGWILTGVGIAGVAVGVVEWLSANSSKNDLTNQQTNGVFPAGYESTFQSTNDSIKSKQTVAAIAGGVGAAALIGGVVMLFVAGGQSSSGGVSVSPAVMPGGGGAMVAGSF